MQTEQSSEDKKIINNLYFNDLGERWYVAQDDPVALLRAEARLRNEWVADLLKGNSENILDIGCGAGFLSNALALRGHEVTGIDLSEPSLEVARAMDSTGKVRYLAADAYELPFDDQSFSVVTAMDFLEHVGDPERVIREVRRVLRPGGRFFFHTFNRNFVAWLIVIKGVEWFVKNTPEKLHVLSLFIKPDELRGMLRRQNFGNIQLRGTRPRLNRAFMKLVFTRRVPDDFSFTWSRSTLISYTGWCQALSPDAASLSSHSAS